MTAESPKPLRGLSAKLFGLTIAAVMMVELVVFLPSAGLYHAGWLQRKLDKAALALIVTEAAPDRGVAQMLGERLLDEIGADLIAARATGDGPAARRIIARAMPEMADQTIDLGALSTLDHIVLACERLIAGGDQVLRVLGAAEPMNDTQVELVLRAQPLSDEIAAFAIRIAALSAIIAGATALAIFFALRALFVSPMRRLTGAMTAFAAQPEAPPARLRDMDRLDELGDATRVFDQLRRELQSSFARKARLAAVGEAVAKFNHDLRNILADAMLSADTLSMEKAPRIARQAEKMLRALDRATALCRDSLRFASEGAVAPTRARFPLDGLIGEAAVQTARLAPAHAWRLRRGADLYADRAQILRLIENLGRNAFEAGAKTVSVTADAIDPDGVAHALILSDDGPGVPAAVRPLLFSPFESRAKSGGTGLGLAIVRDIARAHDGEAAYIDSESGAAFRVTLG